MADPLDLVIMVKEKHRAELDQLAKSLESHGLQDKYQLPPMGEKIPQ